VPPTELITRRNWGRIDAEVAAPRARQRSSTASWTSANNATSVPGSSGNSADDEPVRSAASGNPNWAVVPAASTSGAEARDCAAPTPEGGSGPRDGRANLRTSIPNSAAIALARRSASASAPRFTSSRSPVASAAHWRHRNHSSAGERSRGRSDPSRVAARRSTSLVSHASAGRMAGVVQTRCPRASSAAA
jgi:hypothetical protein